MYLRRQDSVRKYLAEKAATKAALKAEKKKILEGRAGGEFSTALVTGAHRPSKKDTVAEWEMEGTSSETTDPEILLEGQFLHQHSAQMHVTDDMIKDRKRQRVLEKRREHRAEETGARPTMVMIAHR